MSIRAVADISQDERVLRESALKKLLRRPELGAVGGAILVWILFAVIAQDRGFVSLRATANFLEVAAELGILSVMVALLMIGGEFDLSIGSIIGGAGMAITILTTEYQWNIWPALGVSLMMALAVGAINGILVVRTRLPSFIITLGSLFIIRGGTIGLTRLITGRTQVGGIKQVAGYDSGGTVFRQRAQHRRSGFQTRTLGGVPHLDFLVAAHRGHRDVYPAAHPARQLDLWHWRGPERRAEYGCAGQPHEDHPVHGDGSGGVAGRHHPGDLDRRRRYPARRTA